MAEEGPSLLNRINRIRALTPRRFHISENPPFGAGLVLCGHLNANDDSGAQFFLRHDGIRNCKPGIWTSVAVDVPDSEQGMMECILRWVAPGSIDLGQDVEEWAKYEAETRKGDLAAWEEGKGVEGIKGEWREDGQYYDDGGICCVISTDYLTREALKEIVGKEGEKGGYGGYVETLTLSIFDGPKGNEMFCIGGMCCKFGRSVFVSGGFQG